MDFEFKWIHLMGPLLALIAMLALGRNMVKKDKGKQIQPWPAVIMMTLAMSFHFTFGEATLLDRVSIMLADFGIAMILNSPYLFFNKVSSKPFWALGILALMAAIVIYALTHFIPFMWNSLKHGGAEETPGQVLVELGPDDKITELNPVMAKYGATYEQAFPEVELSEDEDLAQYYLVFLKDADQTEDFLEEVREDKENVDYAVNNYQVSLVQPFTGVVPDKPSASFFTNDPKVQSQWWMTPDAVNEVHKFLKIHKPSKKAQVAIVDTGIENNHEDIEGVYKRSKGSGDSHGHGTHCACLAGAETNNGKGVASFNWEGNFIEITAYKALGKDGRGTIETVAQAIIDAADGGADVISMSLGGPHRVPPRPEVRAIQYAIDKGAIVVVAAGNDNADAKHYAPANIPGVIVVSALDHSLNKAGFSNTNTSLKMPISAPGVDIFSCFPKGKYEPKSGTSMATPIVAGLVGIMKAYRPSLTPQEAYKILHETGTKIKDEKKVGRMISPKDVIEQVVK